MSLGFGEEFVVVYAEAGALTAEEVLRRAGGRIGMQEHTVLDHMPLGIDRNTALRHRREIIRRLTTAAVVDIPPVKDISFGGMVRVRLVAVVSADISTKGEAFYNSDLPLFFVLSFDLVVVAINIYSIHEVDGI